MPERVNPLTTFWGPTTARLTKRQRLARVARDLAPELLPYWVSLHEAGPAPHLAPGWYWVPAGDEHPSYLGPTSIRAEMFLLQLIDRKRAAA